MTVANNIRVFQMFTFTGLTAANHCVHVHVIHPKFWEGCRSDVAYVNFMFVYLVICSAVS